MSNNKFTPFSVILFLVPCAALAQTAQGVTGPRDAAVVQHELAALPSGQNITIGGISLSINASGQITLSGTPIFASPTFSGTVTLGSGSTNYLTATGAATDTAPGLNAVGGDTNIGLNFQTKGSGNVVLESNGATVLSVGNAVTGGVNFISISGALTGGSPGLIASGSDSSIGFSLQPKGSGTVQIAALAATGGSITGTTVGASSPSTGAFTTLSASSTVSGTGFSNYLAAPPAIGGTTPAAGKFAALTATGAFLRAVSTGLTAAGTTLATCLALPAAAHIAVLSTVASGSGACLPNAGAGADLVIRNASTTQANIYPATSSGVINTLAAGAAYALPATTTLRCIQTTATQYYCS